MSGPEKDLANVATLFMVYKVNHARIKEYPPNVHYEVESLEDLKNRNANNMSTGWKYDWYRDILMLSCLYGGTIYHSVWCDEEPRIINKPGEIIKIVGSEREVIESFIGLISQIHVEQFGIVTQRAILAGWQVIPMWSTIVNKALAYRIPVPRSLLSDPMRRFNCLDNTISIEHIYSQGCSGYDRMLPALADALTFWGYGERAKYPIIVTIGDVICVNPEKAASDVNIYLKDMHSVMTDYWQLV